MKTAKQNLGKLAAGCAFACCLTSLTPHVNAIEGLQISVQGSNVVLSWPSTNTETYLVQYRPTLTPDSSWFTLTDQLAAAENTNITVFIDSNAVQYPASSPMIASTTTSSDAPMVVRSNGSGSAVPLALYPAGFDLSGFTIFDPITGESVSGNGYTISPPSRKNMQPDNIQPLDASNEDTNQYTGFYQVVRDGAYLYVTNVAIWSDFVTVPVELGNGFGAAGTMSLTENGNMAGDSIQPAGTSLLVDSTQMTNGVHQVSVSTSWSDTNGDYVEADSIPVTVLVSNEISYPDWVPAYGELGNTAVFQAVSAHTNADWQMDVYGRDYAYIGSLALRTF